MILIIIKKKTLRSHRKHLTLYKVALNVTNKLDWFISLQANEDIESPLRNFSFNISHQVPAN